MIGRNERNPQIRPRLSVDVIVDTALAIVDEEGVAGLTITNVARRLGVTQPALYSHFANLDELRSAAATRGAQELSGLVREAVADLVADEALYAMAHAYRGYVQQHPDVYLLQLTAPKSPAHADALLQAAQAVRSVLRTYGIAEEQVIEAHVAFRAAVHGFVHLEASDGLESRSATHDEHFDFFLKLFAAGLRQLSSPETSSRTSASSPSAREDRRE